MTCRARLPETLGRDIPERMEIRLAYLSPELWPRPDGWTVVGLVDGVALAFDLERRPHALADDGSVGLDPPAVYEALLPALDEAGLRLWPGGWANALPAAFGLNTRSTSRDRILRSGLAPNVLRVIAHASSEPDAEGIGRLLSALGHYADRHSDAPAGDVRSLDDAQSAAENALDLLRSVRKGKTFKRED